MTAHKISALPVLIVDDEPEILQLTKMMLESEGIYNILTVEDSRNVLSLLEREKVSVILLDLMMPYLSGLELLQRITSDFPDIPVIVITAMNEVETAVECLKTGAFDYLLKPVEPNNLVSTVKKAFKVNYLENQISSLKNYLLTDSLEHADAFKEIVTCSKKMRAIFQYTEAISPSMQTILIAGETGTGKELMAHAIHSLSGLSGDFVAVNVAGLDDTIFSDTLFGHKKGAFTGAEQPRDGLICKANTGTLFLDEIGDLSHASQLKLLRLLQEHEYYPLGSDIVKTSSARVIVASNHDLEKLIEEGKFRKDLYYRLCAYKIQLPPLRDRLEDIPLLFSHFIEKAAVSLNKQKPVPSAEVTESLMSLHYEGNIREFQAIVFDAVARHHSGVLSYKHFPTVLRGAPPLLPKLSTVSHEDLDPLNILFGKFPSLEEVEQYMIKRALSLSHGKMGVAASILGISRQGLHKRVKTFRLSV